MQIPEVLRTEISGGERILWNGQPRQGVVLRKSDFVAIPFGILWTAFAVYWLYLVVNSDAPLGMVLFGVPFVLIGLYLSVGRFLVEARQRSGTYYAVTPQRVLIVSGLLGKTVKSLNLRSVSDLSLSEYSDGRGIITFGPQHPLASVFGGMPGWPGTDQYVGPRFDLIPESRMVYETIRKAQAESA